MTRRKEEFAVSLLLRQAGAAVLQEYRDVFDSEVLAARVYAAMAAVSKDRS